MSWNSEQVFQTSRALQQARSQQPDYNSHKSQQAQPKIKDDGNCSPAMYGGHHVGYSCARCYAKWQGVEMAWCSSHKVCICHSLKTEYSNRLQIQLDRALLGIVQISDYTQQIKKQQHIHHVFGRSHRTCFASRLA